MTNQAVSFVNLSNNSLGLESDPCLFEVYLPSYLSQGPRM